MTTIPNEIMLSIALVTYLGIPPPLSWAIIGYVVLCEFSSIIFFAIEQYHRQQKYLNFHDIDGSIDRIIEEKDRLEGKQ